MDKIFLRDLEFDCCHGVNVEEKTKKQKFIVSIEIFYDAALAKTSDDIAYAINYSDIYKTIYNEMESTCFNLIEKLAHHLTQTIHNKFSEITRIDVEIKKHPNTWSTRKYGSVGFATTVTF